uniref:Sperm tail PG-rich repeat containing 2 n=1 Tax=Pseudonaja textilis TaxID=8673 RepID=A0A670YQC3_PSETE
TYKIPSSLCVVNELIILCLFPQKIAGCIKYFRKSEAPSIPSQGQAFGYEEAEDGTLIKFSQPERDTTLGPAYYQAVYNETYPTLKYKGVHFGSLREKRLEFKPHEGPGPADYDIIPYVIQPRFAPPKSSTPAPGTYDETRSALECLRKPCRSKSIPFGHTSVRFTRDSRLQTSPGPAFYNILNYRIAAPSLKDVLMETKKKGAFGSTVPRLLYLVNREAFVTPGPADYQVTFFCSSDFLGDGTYSFDLPQLPNELSAVPPPGSYEVHKSFEKSQGKSEYMPPRTVVARRRHASFLSGKLREDALKIEDEIPGKYIT